MNDIDATILDRLFTVIESRKGGDVETSWTAKLLAGGPVEIGKKVAEEATETVIAALTQDRDALAAESADLLYHLLVLWAAKGVAPSDVWRALELREGKSGIEEKASRE